MRLKDDFQVMLQISIFQPQQLAASIAFASQHQRLSEQTQKGIFDVVEIERKKNEGKERGNDRNFSTKMLCKRQNLVQ